MIKTVRLISAILSFTMLFSYFTSPLIPVFALDSGGFIYSVSENGAVLTDVQNIESTDIVVPDTLGGYDVVTIDKAFKSKSLITSVVLPDTVTTITGETFAYCSKLSEVTLSNNLTFIGENAFFACTSLTEIDIPDSVERIGEYAFSSCEKLKSVSLSDNLRRIEKGVFYGSSLLDEIDIPDSVDFITQDAFDGTAYYNNQNNWENGALYLSGHLIKVKKELVSGRYEIRKNTKSISDYAFNSCIDLTAIVIGKDLKVVGESIFYNCKNVKDIYYSGTKNDKGRISIGKNNDKFNNATWHYQDSRSGDINGDGQIDNRDLKCLLLYLSGLNVTVQEVAIDANGDNNTDIKDSVRLFKYLCGFDVAVYSGESGGDIGGDVGPIIHF